MKKKILFAIAAMGAYFGAMAQTYESETLNVWMDNIEMMADGETVYYLHVYENDIEEYCSFNMTIDIPQGLKIAQVKSGRDMVNDIHLSERATTTHVITCGIVNDGKQINVGCYSTENSVFFPDDIDGNPLDELFTIGLIAEPTTRNGIHTLKMHDIKFIRPDINAYYPSGVVSAKLTISGGTGSVESVTVDEDDAIYYDLQGRRVENPHHGIYIGKDKKIIK